MTLTPRAWLMLGGGIAALVLLVALFSTRSALYSEKREHARTEARLAISNASLGRLESELDRALREQQALSSNDALRVKASRETLALADAASAVRQAMVERLRMSAAVVKPETGCEVSAAVMEVWP